MTGQEIQIAAALLALLKTLAASDSFLITACVCIAAVPVLLVFFAYKAIRMLADQIGPMREDIASTGKEFSLLVHEIRQQRDENKQIMANQNMLIGQVVELVERVTRRLTQIEHIGGRN